MPTNHQIQKGTNRKKINCRQDSFPCRIGTPAGDFRPFPVRARQVIYSARRDARSLMRRATRGPLRPRWWKGVTPHHQRVGRGRVHLLLLLLLPLPSLLISRRIDGGASKRREAATSFRTVHLLSISLHDYFVFISNRKAIINCWNFLSNLL